jgi:hypothetical protein
VFSDVLLILDEARDDKHVVEHLRVFVLRILLQRFDENSNEDFSRSFYVLWFVEFFSGQRTEFMPKRGSWLVHRGDAVVTSQNEIEDKDPLRVVWFVIIALAAVLSGAIAAVVTSALSAASLVVLSSAAGAFVAAFGLGVKVHDFFRTP